MPLHYRLRKPASDRRLAKLHFAADFANPQALNPDHFNYLQLEARIKDSSFGVRHSQYSGDFHLSGCPNSLDQDNLLPHLWRPACAPPTYTPVSNQP